MSLDVYLLGETREFGCECSRCGHEHDRTETDEVFSANIIHNLGKMADAAGIYEHLWRPDEIGVTVAAQLVEPLRAGLARLEADPEHYRQFAPSNGWGTYNDFVPWIAAYLRACEDNPDARVEVSR